MKTAALESMTRILVMFSLIMVSGLSWQDDEAFASKRAGSEATASGPAPSRTINKLDIQRGHEEVVVVLLADGVLQYEIMELDRNRLVIDLPNAKTVQALSQSISVQHPLLKEIRIGRYPKKVRLVLDRSLPTQYRVEPRSQSVAITLVGKAAGPLTATSAPATAMENRAQPNTIQTQAVMTSSPRAREAKNMVAAAQPSQTDATHSVSQSDSTPSSQQSRGVATRTSETHVSQESMAPERYVAVFGGVTLPADATKNSGIGALSGVTLSDLDLARSGVVGLKAGAFPLGEKSWIGMETEFFYTSPHVKEQNVTATGPGGSVTATFPGTHVRVATLAFNLLVRYPGTVIQPYIGAGFGMFWGRISGGLGTASDTSPGFNGLAGVKIRLMKNLAAFAEYKYNRASFDFGGDVNVGTLYQAHHLVGGVAFQF